MSPPEFCDLCGLPFRYGHFSLNHAHGTLHFCCLGCKHVYIMLMEASDSGDPSAFKETDLFKKCLDLGIIPRSESDLPQRNQGSAISQSTHLDYIEPEQKTNQGKDAGSATLSINLSIEGMWCPACAWVIDAALKKSHGVIDSVCNFSTDRARCEYEPTITSPAQIIGKIDRLGYRASLPIEGEHLKKNRKEFIRFGISSFLTLNVMMLSFALYAGFFSDLSDDTIYKISWPIFIMASWVLLYGGAKIFQKAWSGVTHSAYSMETLISIGALSAYAYSCYNFYIGSIHQYFDTAAMLITLVLLGKLLERRAKDRIQEELERFFLLMPRKVRICAAPYHDGRYVNIEQLKKNDIFKVEENETVPADGVIMEGKGSVDESSLTGEALPIRKKMGDHLKSGTIITKGMFRVKTESVGEDSALGQMIQIMEKAIEQKIPIEGSTDLLLRWLVPAIIILAFATGIFSMIFGLSQEDSVIRAVTVLVIACPCALGIAIPLARVAGVSLAGQKGILVRNFSAFSRIEKINTFVFDKTGTITEGKWALLEVIPFEAYTKNQVLSMAASLERDSDHHIAMEIKRQADKGHLILPEIKETECHENGVAGWIEEKKIKIGSRNFLRNEISVSSPFMRQDELQFDKTVSRVYMSCDGKLCAIFLFGDRIRGSAFSIIKKLRDLGHRLTLVSGDGNVITKAVGKKLGLNESYGNKLPHEKAILIEEMQRQKSFVSMIGDGVNDAPALAKSDLSFAIHSGNDLSKEAVDVTLMRGDPEQIFDFLHLGIQVRRKISENLVFSFIYNIVSIPVAMTGLLTPVIAVCAMLMSSLTVIGNTLLLTRKAS